MDTSHTLTNRATLAKEEAVLLPPFRRGNHFSFTNLRVIEPVLGYAQQGDVIIEEDGIYSISDKLETAYIKLDKSFKQLVDSVLF